MDDESLVRALYASNWSKKKEDLLNAVFSFRPQFVNNKEAVEDENLCQAAFPIWNEV